MEFDGILYGSLALFLFGVVYFIYNADEIPMLMTLLYAGSGLYRYYIVVENPNQRAVGWVVVAYARSIFNLDNELALRALNLYFLGTALFVLGYIVTKTLIGKPQVDKDVKQMLGQYMLQKRTLLLGIFLAVNIAIFFSQSFLVARALADGYYNSATGVSYFLFLPFALGGIVILIFIAWRAIDARTDPTSKLGFGLVLIYGAFLSYNPGARFNFLSWVIVVGIIYVGNLPVWRKVRVYTIGLAGLLVVYSIAGLARTPGAFLLPMEQQVELALERLETAEDQNLLDGFMMALQVYPENLPYQYGFQHLEILLRPIPRAIWPDKPVGGYANKLGLNDFGSNSGLTIGISESMYGTFYGEGGVGGIILLSLVYGAFFAYIVRRSERYKSDMRFLIKGMVAASLIALIRGGDLAGIVAFIGMSYWPVFIFMRGYGKYSAKFNAWFASVQNAQRMGALAKAQARLDDIAKTQEQPA